MRRTFLATFGAMAAANEAFDLQKLTEDQADALESLRQRFLNEKRACLHNDLYLLHWLRARKFDVDQAEAMLRSVCEVLRKLKNFISKFQGT